MSAMTRACAEAIGLIIDPEFPEWVSWKDAETGAISEAVWNPLGDDAQAMALVKKLNLSISRGGEATSRPWWKVSAAYPNRFQCSNADLNRAIVECVAKMQASKS